jgi:alkylhydroperoxidase family enzyme
MPNLNLVMPADAKGDTRAVYDEIIATWGPRRLGPIWGFWGKDPKVARSIWTLIKRLMVEPTATPKAYLMGIGLVGAVQQDCPRCVMTHQNELRGEGMDADFIELVRNYQTAAAAGKIDRKLYLALRFGESIWFGKEIEESEWDEISATFTDEQIFEMVVTALVESCFSRYGRALARYDESIEWPSEHLAAPELRHVVAGRTAQGA